MIRFIIKSPHDKNAIVNVITVKLSHVHIVYKNRKTQSLNQKIDKTVITKINQDKQSKYITLHCKLKLELHELYKNNGDIRCLGEQATTDTLVSSVMLLNKSKPMLLTSMLVTIGIRTDSLSRHWKDE